LALLTPGPRPVWARVWLHHWYKNTLLAAKGGCICTPLTPPKSATVTNYFHCEWASGNTNNGINR